MGSTCCRLLRAERRPLEAWSPCPAEYALGVVAVGYILPPLAKAGLEAARGYAGGGGAGLQDCACVRPAKHRTKRRP